MTDLLKRIIAALVLLPLIWAVYVFGGRPPEPRFVKIQIWQPAPFEYVVPARGESV